MFSTSASQFLPQESELLHCFPLMTGGDLGSVSQINTFLPKLLCGLSVYHSNRNQAGMLSLCEFVSQFSTVIVMFMV